MLNAFTDENRQGLPECSGEWLQIRLNWCDETDLFSTRNIDEFVHQSSRFQSSTGLPNVIGNPVNVLFRRSESSGGRFTAKATIWPSPLMLYDAILLRDLAAMRDFPFRTSMTRITLTFRSLESSATSRELSSHLNPDASSDTNSSDPFV